MTRFYRECDQYECEVCPRREECDIRERDDDDTIPLDLDANPDQTTLLDEMQRQLDQLRAEFDGLERAFSDFMRELGLAVSRTEGGDRGRD